MSISKKHAMSFKNKVVKIRKPHSCFACYRKFEIGAQMHKWASIYEGEFCSGYTCLTCNEIMPYDKDGQSEGYPEGFVHGWLERNQTPEQLLEQLRLKQSTNQTSCPK